MLMFVLVFNPHSYSPIGSFLHSLRPQVVTGSAVVVEDFVCEERGVTKVASIVVMLLLVAPQLCLVGTE